MLNSCRLILFAVSLSFLYVKSHVQNQENSPTDHIYYQILEAVTALSIKNMDNTALLSTFEK